MSHHYPGPDFAFPNGDAHLNFTDLFAFPKPGDDSKTILIMNSHPSVGVNPVGPTSTIPFSTNAMYELMIDTDGDNVVNIAYSVRFVDGRGGEQIATLRRIDGTSYDRTGKEGDVIVEAWPISIGAEPRVTDAGGYRFFAGRRSDPFFFDVLGAVDGLKFTGQDFFADKNVSSIVLEVPNANLGRRSLGCGREPSTAPLELGFKRTEALTPRKNPSLPETRRLRILPVIRRTTNSSFPSSLIRSSTRAATRRRELRR